jgi:glyoxylase-like metal-dependent hydrolase (beta-lactamase superfamily II)
MDQMLEDDFTYVLRKALAGNGLTSAEAAARAGLPESRIREILAGSFSADAARRLAPVLGLNAEACARHPAHHPGPLALPGIERLDLPFDGERVNAWLVRADDGWVLFDAGYVASDLIRVLESRCGRMPDRVFITHAHRDHVGALGRFLDEGIPVHSAGLPGTVRMKPGDKVCCGPLVVRACDLSGHASPALGFHIEGLAGPVLVTGDALFAGSIGGCGSPASYRHALCKLRETLGPLPETTVLLPGHGPATTLGEERVGNPFL